MLPYIIMDLPIYITGLLQRTRILFSGRPIACNMGVLKAFIVDLLTYCIDLEFYVPAGPLHVK